MRCQPTLHRGITSPICILAVVNVVFRELVDPLHLARLEVDRHDGVAVGPGGCRIGLAGADVEHPSLEVDRGRRPHRDAVGLFATGCWLEMQDLIDSAIESILRQMAPETLAFLIRLVTTNYYGRPGDRILESAKAMLSRDGWEMPCRKVRRLTFYRAIWSVIMDEPYILALYIIQWFASRTSTLKWSTSIENACTHM